MATLTKSVQGLLYEDDFSEQTLMWTLSPSDRASMFEFGDNGLHINHCDKYLTCTMFEPEEDEYALICKIDHIPYDKTDIAGVIVVSSNKRYIECQTYLATGPSDLGNEHTLNDILDIITDLKKFVKYKIYGTDDDPNAKEILINPDGTEIIVNDDEPFVDIVYQYIKVHKKENNYSFYASANSIDWIKVGDVRMDFTGVIGLFIYKAEKQEVIDNSHCYIKYFNLYKSKYLYVNNIPKQCDFEILSGDNVILRSDSAKYIPFVSRDPDTNICAINTTMLPIPMENARLRIYNKSNYEITLGEYQMGTVYGGDTYDFDVNLQYSIGNDIIHVDELINLGKLYIRDNYIKIKVTNIDTIVSSIKTIQVIRYSQYYAGDTPILIATTVNDSEIPDIHSFDKQAELTALLPGDSAYIYICLNDVPMADNFMTVNNFRFKLVVT